MNSNNLKTGLVAILVVVALLVTFLQEKRVRQLKTEVEDLRVQAAQAKAHWGETKYASPPNEPASPGSAISSTESQELAGLRATNEVLHREVLRLRGQISAASLARPSVAPEAVASNSPETTNAASQGFSGLMKGALEQQIMGQFERMKSKLKLSPDQETAIRGILQKQLDAQSGAAQKMFSGKLSQEEVMSLQKGAGNPEEQIKALLNPDQLSAYQDLKKEESVSNARLAANAEMLQMQNILGLSQEQQDQVYEALYQQTLDAISGGFAKNLPKGADVNTMMQMQIDQKAKSLEGILTPDQMQRYRQMQQKQAEMVRQLMPGTSTPTGPVPGK